MRTFLLIFTLIVCSSVPGRATALITISEVSAGHYRIEGQNLDEVAAINLSIDFDAASLQSPTLTAGSFLQGMLFAGNPSSPGRLRLGAVGTQPLSGSGTLALIDGTPGHPAFVIQRFSARLSNPAGQPLAVQTGYFLPGSAPPITTDDVASENLPPVASATAGLILLTTGEMQAASPRAENPVVPSLPPPLDENPSAPTEQTAWPAARAMEKERTEYPAILDRFRTFTGARTLESLAELFAQDPAMMIQEPAILLSDGRAAVNIRLQLASTDEPSFALKNARLLKSGLIGPQHFLVCCIPAPGAVSASLVLLNPGQLVEIPLTIAPPVHVAALPISPGDSLPKLDLDTDGRHTFIDDYILVANLLGSKKKTD